MEPFPLAFWGWNCVLFICPFSKCSKKQGTQNLSTGKKVTILEIYVSFLLLNSHRKEKFSTGAIAHLQETVYRTREPSVKCNWKIFQPFCADVSRMSPLGIASSLIDAGGPTDGIFTCFVKTKHVTRGRDTERGKLISWWQEIYTENTRKTGRSSHKSGCI